MSTPGVSCGTWNLYLWHLNSQFGVWDRFSDQGLDWDSLHWECGVSATGLPGKSLSLIFWRILLVFIWLQHDLNMFSLYRPTEIILYKIFLKFLWLIPLIRPYFFLLIFYFLYSEVIHTLLVIFIQLLFPNIWFRNI